MKNRVNITKTFAAACVVLCGIAGSALGETKDAAKKPAAEAKKAAAGPKKITVDLGGGVKLEMTLIPAGEFLMGSAESAEATAEFFNKTYGGDTVDGYCLEVEHPQHRVRITRPFYLCTYHVTRGQFAKFVADQHYRTEAEKGEKPVFSGATLKEKESWRNAGFEQSNEHPVVYVSWNDAAAFCEWLSKKEGKTYRLPTEAEWEYACRAGTTTRYYSGDDPETLATVGNVADATYKAKFRDGKQTIKASDAYVFTAPVGRFKPNAFGLFDMHGNASQWCADWYAPKYYAKSPPADPTGPESGATRVLRGGAWDDEPSRARSADRGGLPPFYRFGWTGFRVARTQ